MVREAAGQVPVPASPEPVTALLITDDMGLARGLAGLLRRLSMPIQLTLVDPTALEGPPAHTPSLVFVDAEGRPYSLKAARLQYPEARCIAIVGRWSETEAEVRGFADYTLHKPLRSQDLLALERLLQPYPLRLSA